MSRLIPATLIAALALHPALALACGPTPPAFNGDGEAAISVSVGRIAGLVWLPLLIDGQEIPADSGLSLEIAPDGKVTGMTGCNRLAGTAELDAGVIEFSPLAVTEMACLDPLRKEREALYLKALADVRYFIVAPEGLWLMREDGSVAVCLG